MIAFPLQELKVALAVLKGIYAISPLSFIKEAIDDIEYDLQPKELQTVNYFHLCKKCFMEVDERSDNSLKITRDGDIQWKHRKCVDLKQNRPN